MTTEVYVAPPIFASIADVLGVEIDKARVVPLAGGLSAHIVGNPGDALNRSTHLRIYAGLIPLTTSSFDADMTPYWAQRSKEGYLERLAEFVMIADADGTWIGWTGFHVLPFDTMTLVYIDSTGMSPDRQSRGAMRELMRARLHDDVLARCSENLPVYLTARSESPIFYRLMRGLVADGNLFPQPISDFPSDVVDAAELLSQWLGQRHLLNSETLAVQGAYEALDELYGELPTTGDENLDKLFRERLGPLDAYLLVGRFR